VARTAFVSRSVFYTHTEIHRCTPVLTACVGRVYGWQCPPDEAGELLGQISSDDPTREFVGYYGNKEVRR
jgi:hypothetical protein